MLITPNADTDRRILLRANTGLTQAQAGTLKMAVMEGDSKEQEEKRKSSVAAWASEAARAASQHQHKAAKAPPAPSKKAPVRQEAEAEQGNDPGKMEKEKRPLPKCKSPMCLVFGV